MTMDIVLPAKILCLSGQGLRRGEVVLAAFADFGYPSLEVGPGLERKRGESALPDHRGGQ
jgi:hypothetical protein